jgi:hypothetical protein
MVMNDDSDIPTTASIPFQSKSYTAAAIEKENINKKIESAMLEQSNKIEEFTCIYSILQVRLLNYELCWKKTGESNSTFFVRVSFSHTRV